MNTAEILMFYEMFDDGDISTERLLAMTADAAGCDVGDVVDALTAGDTSSGAKATYKKPVRKNKRRWNRSIQ